MPQEPRLGPSPARVSLGVGPLSPSRAAVLEALQHAGAAATAAELSAATGLHVNTLREHLEALVDRGLVVRARATATGPGRPALTYSAAAQGEPDPRVREYAGLATALAGHLARTSADPAGDARAAGEAWSPELLASDGRPAPVDPAASRSRVVELFDRLGFDPDANADATSVALRRCPLLDAAVRHPEVVCSVHLGVARGVVQQLGGDPDAVGLAPFSEPGACRLTLAGRRAIEDAAPPSGEHPAG